MKTHLIHLIIMMIGLAACPALGQVASFSAVTGAGVSVGGSSFGRAGAVVSAVGEGLSVQGSISRQSTPEEVAAFENAPEGQKMNVLRSTVVGSVVVSGQSYPVNAAIYVNRAYAVEWHLLSASAYGVQATGRRGNRMRSESMGYVYLRIPKNGASATGQIWVGSGFSVETTEGSWAAAGARGNTLLNVSMY